MLGRLQWTVEKTIASYQDLWKGMADFSQSRILMYPGKTKSHNARGLAKSLSKILNSEASTLHLGSDPKMCRTYVTFLILQNNSNYCLVLSWQWKRVKGDTTLHTSFAPTPSLKLGSQTSIETHNSVPNHLILLTFAERPLRPHSTSEA